MISISALGFVITAVFAVQISTTTDHGQSSPKEIGCCRDHCGLPGRDGRDGRDGIQGPYGPPGSPGEKGPPGQSFFMESNLEKILNILTEKMAVMIAQEVKLTRSVKNKAEDMTGEGRARSGPSSRENTQQTDLAGAVYTRWGRTECPSYSTTLYQGLMAGSYFLHRGSGGNHLCLPLNPQWNKTFGGQQSGAYLYGSEFELSSNNPVFHQTNSGGDFFHQRDIQCAVCYTPGRPSHVMIPARLECPIGWTVEYLGFLMASHHTYRRSEYVCVDQDPDTQPATAKNVNGNLLYIVEAVCGPLPCPNYADGYEVTCVVCTK